MSFKEFSAAHSAPAKDNAKDAPPDDRPPKQADKTPAEVAPSTKS